MACPLPSSKEWKDFVKEVGSDFQAHAIFYKNGNQIPEKKDLVSLNEDESIFVEDLIKFTKIRENIIFSLNKTIQENRSTKDSDSLNRLIELTQSLENASINDSIQIIISNGLSLTKNLLEQLENNKDINSLKKTADYLGAFNNIDDIIGYVKSAEIENKTNTLKKLGLLTTKIKSFRQTYLKTGKELLIKTLAKESSFIRERERIMLQSEYEVNNPPSEYNGTRKEYLAERDEYVQTKLELKEKELVIRTEDYIRDQFNRIPQDISSMTAWIDDPRGIKDHMIQLITQMLDRADMNAIDRFSKSRMQLINAYNEFIKNGEARLQKERYEGIIEKVEGKETQYLVDEIYSEARLAYNRLYHRQMDELIEPEVKVKEKQEFIDTYVSETYLNKQVDLFASKDKEGKFIPLASKFKKDFRNPQYDALLKDSRKYTFYNALVEYNKDSDKIAGRGKLGLKLPGMRKQNVEFLQEKGIVEYTKQAIKDSVKLNQNDVEAGAQETIDGVTKSATDNNGKIIQKVNLPFRNKIELQDQSYDLVGMSLANRYVSLNYQEKNNLKASIEIARDILANRDVLVTKGDNRLVSGFKSISKILSGAETNEITDISIKGRDSNSYKALVSIIEDRLYGVGNIDAGRILGMDGNKLTNGLMKWSGNTFLIANIYGATSNILQGKVMNFLEGVKGNHYNGKNLRAGERLYWADTNNILRDIEAKAPESKTNLLLEKFLGTSVGFDTITHAFVKNNKLKRLVNTKTLHALNTTAEHYIQSTLMYSILDATEVQGKKLHELYSVSNGTLVYKGPKDKKGNPVIDEVKVARKIKGIVATLQGNYDPNNKAMVQRYWFGKLAFFLRKWIVRTVKRRYMGIGTVNKNMREMLKNEPHLVHYSQETEEFQEGTYTSAIRFMVNMAKDIRTLQISNLGKDWNNLTDLERQNIRAAVAEVALMTLAILSATLLAGLAEQEDDDDLYIYAYLTRRLYSELAFYVPAVSPTEALRVMRTPSASMNMLELSAKTMNQLIKDSANMELEEFKHGRREGKSKSIHNLNKLFNPIYKNGTDRDVKEMYKWLAEGRY